MRSSGNVVQKTPSPNSAAYRKTFMTRRHSSGTSDTPIVRDNSPPTQTPRSSVNNPLNAKPLSAFGSYPLVADERRWSIANAECRRPSVLFSVSGLTHLLLSSTRERVYRLYWKVVFIVGLQRTKVRHHDILPFVSWWVDELTVRLTAGQAKVSCYCLI